MRQDRLYSCTDSSTVMNTFTWMVFDKMRQCLLTFKSIHFTVAEAVSNSYWLWGGSDNPYSVEVVISNKVASSVMLLIHTWNINVGVSRTAFTPWPTSTTSDFYVIIWKLRLSGKCIRRSKKNKQKQHFNKVICEVLYWTHEEMPLCWDVTNVGKQSKQDIGLKMLLQAMWIELQNGRAAKSFPWFCLWHSEGQENSWEPLQSPADPRCSYLSFFSPALSLHLFSSSISLRLSPVKEGEKKQTGKAVFQLWNGCCLPIAFPPRCSQSWVKMTKLCKIILASLWSRRQRCQCFKRF